MKYEILSPKAGEKVIKSLKQTLLFVLLMFSCSFAKAQLSGTYTIDPSSAASNSNYKSISSACSDLDSGIRHDGGVPNGKGVNGAVVFKIADGTYNEYIVLGQVTGAGSTNTITFQSASGDRNKVVIRPRGKDTTKLDTLVIEQHTAFKVFASYVTFNKLTFRSIGTADSLDSYGNTLLELMEPSTNITIKNCRFLNHYGTNISTQTVSNINISNNSLYVHAYGNNISMNATNGTGKYALYNVAIDSNQMISDSTNESMDLTDISGLNIRHNSFKGRYQFAAIYVYECQNVFEFSNNTVISEGTGISFTAANTSKKPCQFFNNVISATGTAVNFQFGTNINFYNNSIWIEHGMGLSIYGSPGSNWYSTSGVSVVNNCITGKGAIALELWDYTTIDRMDYNNYYVDSATVKYGFQPVINYKDLATWQSIYFFDSNSISVDPQYASHTDLNPSNVKLKAGQALAGVTYDINGRKRDKTKPTIGAYELADENHLAFYPTSSSFCAGNTITFTDSSTLASACGIISTHFWKFGDGDTATTNHPATHNYAKAGMYRIWMIVTSSKGCKDSTYRDVYIDSTCVWPGDANNDKIANITDILNIGLAYSDTGSARDSSYSRTKWFGQQCKDWKKTFKSGLNHKYADCDGDGKVSLGDVATLGYNYGFTHPKTNIIEQATALDPSLFVKFSSDSVLAGDTVKAKIYLGTSAIPASNVYGMVFTLSYDPKYVDSGSAVVNFSNCWVGQPGKDIITLTHDAYKSGQLYVGLSRINQASVKGYGEIGELSIVMQDNVAGKDWIHKKVNLNISGVKMISEKEEILPLNTAGDSMEVYQQTGITQTKANDDRITLYPNPAAEELYINTALNIKNVSIYDLTGKQVSTQLLNGKSPYKIETANLSQGVYSIRIQTKDSTISKLFIRQ